MTDIANRDLAISFLKNAASGKLDEAYSLTASNFRHHNAYFKADAESLKAGMADAHKQFPNTKIDVQRAIAEGDLVTVLWSGRGTNTGIGNGIPATGKKVEGRGITIWRIVDGKITEEWSEFDQLGIMQQLGLIPSTTQ